jgi:hypothetical protein
MLQRFFRAELSRGENRLIVRHLLTRCRHCLRVVHEADEATGFRITAPPHSSPALHLAGRLG